MSLKLILLEYQNFKNLKFITTISWFISIK